ncbi:MAG: TolC family protein, partial [Saccharofermentanaceae bacterium]
VTSLFLTGIIILTGISDIQAQQPLSFKTSRITVAVVYDGPAKMNQEFHDYVVKEVRSLMSGQVTVDFIDRSKTTGTWTTGSVQAINTQLLADTSVDIIISMGVLASQNLAMRKMLSKPVVAGMVLNHEMQKLPWQNGSSGIPNLSYIQLKSSVDNEYDELNKVAHFKKLAVVICRDYHDILIPDNHAMVSFDSVTGLRLNLILADTSADAILQSIPRDADAVYLDALFRLPYPELIRLVDSLNVRKLPSFGFDESLVDDGVLASVYPCIIERLSKRIALNIQQILLGQNASALPVELLAGKGFFLNLGTFGKLGLKPLTWDLFTEATIVDLQRRDTNVRFISLPDLISLALDSNQDLLAQKFTVMAGSKDINIARSALLPYLDVNAMGVLNDKLNYQPPQMVSANASASQILYSEPYRSNVKVAQSNLVASEEGLNSQKLNIGNQVAQAYLNILENRSNFYLLINNLMITRSNLEIAKMKKDAGSAGEDEVLRWQIEVAKAKRNVISSYGLIAQGSYTLLQLIHVKNLTSYDLGEFRMEKSGLLIADSSFFGIFNDPVRLQKFSQFLVKEGMDNSPALRQYQYLIEAQQRIYRSNSISRYIPTATAFGNYGNVLYQAPYEISEGIPGGLPNYSWSVGAKIDIPLFTGLKNNALAQKARLTLAQLKSEQQSVKDKLESSILSNIAALVSAYYDLKQMRIAEESAIKNFQIVNNQYLLGNKSILDVLDAQQQNLITSMSKNTSFNNLVKNYFNLQQSLGRLDYIMTTAEKADFWRRLDAFMQ